LTKRATIGLLILLGSFCLPFAVSLPEATKAAFDDVVKNPGLYHGKLIETRGFLVQEYENSALYANEKWQGTKGIWVTSTIEPYPLRAIRNHYVDVTGVFDANDHGHLGQFKGTLTVKKFLVVQNDGKVPDKVSK
jgi:hypothetical protein